MNDDTPKTQPLEERRAAYGTIELCGPGTVVAGSYATWEVTYTVGRLGMDDGSTLKLATSMTSDWGPPQFERPSGDNYCTVSTSGEATVDGHFDPDGHVRPVKHAIVVDVYDGALAPGDQVTVTLGDTSGGSLGIRAQTFPEVGFAFIGLVDPFGTAEAVALEDELTVDVCPGTAVELEAVARQRGDTVSIAVRAVDEWGNVASGYAGSLDIRTSAGVVVATVEARNGTAQATLDVDASAAGEGAVRWTVSDGALQVNTNPLIPGSPIRWGDLHGQSTETVGTGSVEAYFEFARYQAFLDFVSHAGNDFQISDDFWDRLQHVVETTNVSGAFVTFLGYEWSANTPNGGDHNVYFRDGTGEIRRSSRWQIADDETRHRGLTTVEALYDHYADRDDVLVIPHQGGRPASLDVVDESLTPFLELVSVWGVFEWFGAEAIYRGHHLGFVGGSDDHTGRPGASRPTNHRYFLVNGGLTGVPDVDLTRASLWDALAESRCYATTGARIHLDVDCCGAGMGESTSTDGSPVLQTQVFGTAPLTHVDCFRDGERIESLDCTTGKDRYEVVWTGARSKDRFKVQDWSGGLTLNGGTFTDVDAFGFQHPEHGLTDSTPTQLKWVAKTAGNYQGVRFGVDGPESATLSLRPSPFSGSFTLADLAEDHDVDLGPVGKQVACRRTGVATALDATIMFEDDVDPGTYAYHVRVRQTDGEMAWSSPVSVTVKE